METYYGYTKRGNVVVYLPYHLAGISHDGINYKFRTDFAFLDRLEKSFKKRGIDEESFLVKGWKINVVELNEHYLRAFRKFLDKGLLKKYIDDKANEVVELIDGICFNKYENITRDKKINKIEHEGEYKEDYPYDNEDYGDDWWKRGDDFPLK